MVDDGSVIHNVGKYDYKNMITKRTIAYVVIGWCLTIFVYGFATFPDAPWKACGDGHFCGKMKQVHSFSEYQAFTRWETALFISWPFGIACVVWLRRAKKTD